MSIEMCVLASGSAGNCTAVRTPAGVMLIDAGLGPRTTAQRLRGTGVSVADVSALCLTHLDHDHFNRNWLGTILTRGVGVFCHLNRVDDLLRTALGSHPDPEQLAQFRALIHPFNGEPFEPLPGVEVRPILLAHDRLGSSGFVVSGFDRRVGFATDLGRVPDALFDEFCDLDVLAIESNYDHRMQVDSPRPWFLKQRIMGGSGHLSNQQAFDTVRQIFNRCEAAGTRLPAHVVLLHRSRECNCPDLLRKLFSRDARVASRLVLAEQHERTPWLGAAPRGFDAVTGGQLQLAWG
jgi:phosphoribosyl 1,2-cyclic phosphodiesterase